MKEVVHMGRISKWQLSVGLVSGIFGASLAGVAMAQGGLSANLALSGTIFNIAIGNVDGTDFSLFVDGEQTGENEVLPVTRLRFGQATADDLCLHAQLGNVPKVGPVSFRLMSSGDNSVEADGLLVGARLLEGDLKLENPQLGVDVSQVNSEAYPGAWGLASNSINVQARNIDATAVAANSLTLRNVNVTVEKGQDNVCGS